MAKNKKDRPRKNRWRFAIGSSCLVFVALIMFTATRWAIGSFGELSVETMFYQMMLPTGGTNSDVVVEFVVNSLIPSLIGFAAMYFVAALLLYNKLDTKKRYNVLRVILIACVVISFIWCADKLVLFRYLSNVFSGNTIYEERYIDASEVNVKAPKQKKNLILIHLESMESTHGGRANGGQTDDNLIPFITELAKDNICFSDTDNEVGGFVSIPGTGFTYGALSATVDGVPFGLPCKPVLSASDESQTVMDGVTALGDILHQDGYNQVYMCGSDARFSGRNLFYKTHGDYEICDYDQAVKDGAIPEGYSVFWGFEDLYLYDYAKVKLTELAAKEEPFNFTMLTVDTHHPDGFVCSKCPDEYELNYANVIKCADNQFKEFYEWLSSQDFFENSVVVVVGDHISMASEYYRKAGIEYNSRRVYNCFIGCEDAVGAQTALKNRTFTAMDLYPTIMTALGYSYDGHQLGLGVDLFSGEKTLAEEMGVGELTDSFSALSNYYLFNISSKKSE